jgi:hypothetical protein
VKSEARLFLEELFAGKPQELHVLLWTLPEKLSYWFQNVEDAIRFAESVSSQNLYVGIGLSGEDYGPHNRCKSSETVGIVGLWADFDLKSEAHAKDNLPATVEDALELLPKEFPPTFIILTGNGLHCWWLFREPLIFATEAEREAAVCMANRWQSFFRLTAAGRGWAFDRLKDLARVLRVPGTRNYKDSKNPKPVCIRSQTDHRYNPSDFLQFLDGRSIPSEEERERREQTVKQAFGDKDFVIDPNASIPPEILERFLETDPRFKRTWFCQREDMLDKSRTGYDMALANFGAWNGLSEQQTADLIIQHRRINGQQQRTTQAYFKLTIGKAFKERPMPEFMAGAPEQTSTHAPASPTDRAQLCEQISNILGIRVLRIVKVAGQDPTYRIELESVPVIFPSVEHLITQKKFQMKIASAADHMVPLMRADRWNAVAKMMLAALTVEDGGDEADAVGAAKMHVDSYLRESRFIEVDAELQQQTRFMPAVYDGRIAIRAKELLQHINKSGAEHLAIKDVTAMLSILGASSLRLKNTKLRDQTRWLLPVSDFPPESYVPGTGEKAYV